MLVTYLFSMRIVKHRVNSSLIAFLFVMSPLYYRFTVYWPFLVMYLSDYIYYFMQSNTCYNKKDRSVNFSHYHHHDK